VRTLLGGVIMALFAVTVPAEAGVGMLDEGTQLYNAHVSVAGGNKHWDVQRQVITSLCQRRNVTMLQGYEYGYSYFHTIFANAAFVYRKCGQINRAARVNAATGRVTPGWTVLGGRAVGLGDIQLGVRTRINHRDTAAWEALLIIPTGYDNTSASALGRGALGLGLGLLFSSDVPRALVKRSSWGWTLGTRYIYFFSGKGNSLSGNVAAHYAFTDTDFQQTGDFGTVQLSHSVSFGRNGVQRQLFFNQVPRSMTNSDQTTITLQYSHAFIGTGLSTSVSVGKAVFGRNNPIDYHAGLGLSYRWRD